MRKKVSFFILVTFILLQANGQPFSSPRVKYNFNPGWKMMVGDDAKASAISYDDKDWKDVILKPYLQREPTPAGESYQLLRTALKVITAKAGANNDKVTASYDDNEMSDWVNDGQLSTAWIEYELKKPAAISEVTLKLNNFRTRTYPIRISVGGKEVFKDTTTRNLGYLTAVFKPQTGKKIKIELYSNGEIKEDKSTEVNGKKLDDGVTRNDANAKETFSIIEAEFYESKK